MILAGRRIHIVGSAAADTDESKLSYAHAMIRELVDRLLQEGATFVLPFGREPRLEDRTDGPSITFDWTVAEAIGDALKSRVAHPTGVGGRLIATIATSKTDSQIPDHRRSLYDFLRAENSIQMEFVEPGWSSGAYRRDRLAQLGDIMIGLSGGEGVEHQALTYSTKGKPVIPLDLQLGASQRDGSGGAARLFSKARTAPEDFFRLEKGHSASELLDRTATRDGNSPTSQVVENILNLLKALEPPQAFYVRLLNPSVPEFASVDQFFRGTVDPFLQSLGYSPFEMGRDKHEFAWMNEAIFSKLHHSSVVVVDLTALRQNCFMELGYAFGNRQRVIVTAHQGTKFPFDAESLDAFLWNPADTPTECVEKLRKHWERNIGRPDLVTVRKAR